MQGLPDGRLVAAISDYYEAVSLKDLTRWLSLFAKEAEVHDPVGAPAASGRKELEEIWRVMASPFEKLSIQPDDIFYAGSGAAVKWSAEGTGVNHGTVEFEGISVFEMAEDGKIQTVMSYWDPAEMMIRLADS